MDYGEPKRFNLVQPLSRTCLGREVNIAVSLYSDRRSSGTGLRAEQDETNACTTPPHTRLILRL
jgi:hypothetical protein